MNFGTLGDLDDAINLPVLALIRSMISILQMVENG
jgi:hypothetical protein